MWLNLCRNGNKRTYGWICSKMFPFIPLCQDRVNICFELVLLLVRCERKACCFCQLLPGKMGGRSFVHAKLFVDVSRKMLLELLLELIESRVRTIWRCLQLLELSWFLHLCMPLCSSVPQDFAFWWSALGCHSRAGCSWESSWSLQLQVSFS